MAIQVGQEYTGIVKKIVNFGAFIEIEDEMVGLCHISEISDDYVKKIEDYIVVGQEVLVKVLEVKKDGKMNLSMSKVSSKKERVDEKSKEMPEVKFKKSADRSVKKTGRKFENLLTDFLNESSKNTIHKSAKRRNSRRTGYSNK